MPLLNEICFFFFCTRDLLHEFFKNSRASISRWKYNYFMRRLTREIVSVVTHGIVLFYYNEATLA